VGLNIFDEQHQTLIGIINSLYAAIDDSAESDAQEKILNNLLVYTITHFTEEEKYFAQFNYPEKDRHKGEHDKFCKVIKDFTHNYYSGVRVKNIEVLDFLVDWLKNHIQHSDKKYTEFFISKGLR